MLAHIVSYWSRIAPSTLHAFCMLAITDLTVLRANPRLIGDRQLCWLGGRPLTGFVQIDSLRMPGVILALSCCGKRANRFAPTGRAKNQNAGENKSCMAGTINRPGCYPSSLRVRGLKRAGQEGRIFFLLSSFLHGHDKQAFIQFVAADIELCVKGLFQ